MIKKTKWKFSLFILAVIFIITIGIGYNKLQKNLEENNVLKVNLNINEEQLNCMEQHKDILIENYKNSGYKNSELKMKIKELKKVSKDESSLKKVIYLTFDDGPSNNTIKILDILKEENIKGTFFVNGRQECKNIYLRLYSEGHVIGNHTYSHIYSQIYSSINAFKDDVDKLDSYLDSIGIETAKIIRFPGGSNNTISHRYGGSTIMDTLTKNVLDEGYQYYDWDVISGDSTRAKISKEEIIEIIKVGCSNRQSAIILFHDAGDKKATVEALPEIIQYLKGEGYEFRVLTDKFCNVVHFK